MNLKKTVIPWGYSWFFPKKSGWNIGIGTAKPNHFKESFNKFKDRFPEVKEWKVGIIPISKPIKSYSKNTILVGDSASQVLAGTGAGTLTSMICARIAADKIIEMSKNNFRNVDLSQYEKAWKKKLSKIFASAYNYHRLLKIANVSEYFFHILLKVICKISSDMYRKRRKYMIR